MDTIRRTDYFSVEVPNKVGERARLLGALRDDGINLTAFTAFPSGRLQTAKPLIGRCLR